MVEFRNDRDNYNKGDQYNNRDRNYNRGDKDRNRGPPLRDDRDNRPIRREKEKDENIENKMPKFKADVKPVNIYSYFNKKIYFLLVAMFM